MKDWNAGLDFCANRDILSKEHVKIKKKKKQMLKYDVAIAEAEQETLNLKKADGVEI